MIKRVTIPRL